MRPNDNNQNAFGSPFEGGPQYGPQFGPEQSEPGHRRRRRHPSRSAGEFGGHGMRGRGFGPGFGGGPGRGGRRRRGDIRGLLLAALLDGPAHGYELMSRLEEKSGGAWRPSAGSVYPTLQQLEDEGLVKGEDAEGRRVFDLTDTGREQADSTTLDRLSSDRAGGNPELWTEVRQLMMAAKQVGSVGNAEQVTEATTAVREARKALYRLLAEA